jgi:hypothetical protein
MRQKAHQLALRRPIETYGDAILARKEAQHSDRLEEIEKADPLLAKEVMLDAERGRLRARGAGAGWSRRSRR